MEEPPMSMSDRGTDSAGDPGALPRPCSTPHSAPAAWLKASASEPTDPDPLRAAIELVLGSPEAVAEIIGRAPPAAFTLHLPVGTPRHDGWTGERMAAFLEILADTGLVTEACRVVGMSRDSAYGLRNRDPVFAAAMRAAQAKARPQVADGLLERSITGTVEHYYRDGVLVGERRHYESWLALAVLKRLDKQAEEDRRAQRVRGTGEHDDDDALSARIAGDWQAALDALRTGGTGALPALLEAKTDKADIPPLPGLDPSDNVWKNDDGVWMTCFPPPPSFDGHENRPWDGFNYYERACTAEEADLVEAHAAAMEAEERAELTADAEAERDSWFAMLRNDLGREALN